MNVSTWGPAFARFRLKNLLLILCNLNAQLAKLFGAHFSASPSAASLHYLWCPPSQSSSLRSQYPLSRKISPVSWEAPQHLGRCRQMELQLLSAPLRSSVCTSGCFCALAMVLLFLNEAMCQAHTRCLHPIQDLNQFLRFTQNFIQLFPFSSGWAERRINRAPVARNTQLLSHLHLFQV